MKEDQQLKCLSHAKERSPKNQKQSSTKAAPSKQTNHHVIEAAKQTQRFQLAPPEDDPISESDSERSQRSVGSEDDEQASPSDKSKNKSSYKDSGETKRKAKQNPKSAPKKSAKDEFWTSNSDSRRRYFAEVDAFVLETEPAL